MVRLSKIYTKVGDGGQTMLGDGSMVPKDHARVAAYGDVDEANAAVGVAVAMLDGAAPPLSDIRAELLRVQHDLFDLGADLCVPIAQGETAGSRLRITPEQAARLESAIDRANEGLKPLDSFVLPGGTPLAAALHVARTVTRRAERRVAALLAAEPRATSQEAMVYLNRLSDLLFVLARLANTRGLGGAGDVLWVPGKHRGEGAS